MASKRDPEQMLILRMCTRTQNAHDGQGEGLCVVWVSKLLFAPRAGPGQIAYRALREHTSRGHAAVRGTPLSHSRGLLGTYGMPAKYNGACFGVFHSEDFAHHPIRSVGTPTQHFLASFAGDFDEAGHVFNPCDKGASVTRWICLLDPRIRA